MSTHTHSSNAERFGHWLGRCWRGYVRLERQVLGWLVAQGLPAAAATAIVWIAKLAVLGVLLYAAFWLALLIVVSGVVVWRQQYNAPEEPDFLGRKAEERDHRESLFYDPACFNDDPDPRFEKH